MTSLLLLLLVFYVLVGDLVSILVNAAMILVVICVVGFLLVRVTATFKAHAADLRAWRADDSDWRWEEHGEE